MKVIKTVIEDKALSEVIFRIGTRRVYGLELLESYKCVTFDDELEADIYNNQGKDIKVTFNSKDEEKEAISRIKETNNKEPKITQSTLSKQIDRLIKEGFINEEQGFEKNKKYYSVNINKIIEEFMKYSVKYIQNLPVDSDWKKRSRDKSMWMK